MPSKVSLSVAFALTPLLLLILLYANLRKSGSQSSSFVILIYLPHLFILNVVSFLVMSIKLSLVTNPFFKSLPTIELFVKLPSFLTSTISLVREESKDELVKILEVQKVLP